MTGTTADPTPPGGPEGEAPAGYVTSAVEQFAGWGERPAVVHGDRVLTFRDLLDLAHRTARVLHDDGLRRGDGLVLLADNPPEMLGIGLAAHVLGVRYTPVHAAGGRFAEHILRDAAPRAVVVADAGDLPAVRSLELAEAAGVKHRYTIGPVAGDVPPDAVDLLAAGRAGSADPVPVRAGEGDVARVLYTGGTTGLPKGVAYTFGALAAATGAWAGAAPPPGMRFLAVTPLAHAAGAIAFGLLRQGVTVEVSDSFDAGALLARIGEAAKAGTPVTTYLYPPYFYRLLDHPDLPHTDLSALLSVSYGSAPMAPHRLAEAVRRFGPRLRQSYALTEAIAVTGLGPQEHALAAESRAELFGSVGRAVPGVEVRVTGDAGEPLPTGATGAVEVRGATVMRGYWNRPDATAEVLRDGWLRTGDLGRLDADGYLYLAGRDRDVVVVDGTKCTPQTVEDVLATHPEVRESVVLGVPDERTGEALLAVCRTAAPPSDAPALREELRTLVREALGSVLVPARIELVTDIPTASYGKPDRTALRRRFVG